MVEVTDSNYVKTDEITTYGRQIEYGPRLDYIIDKITDVCTDDIYNDTKSFNSYERLIKWFDTLTRGYQDEEYKEVLEELLLLKPKTIDDKVKILDQRSSNITYLLKRKGFTPPDDVTNNDWIITRRILDRIDDEMDAQILVHGGRGKGKSTLAAKLSMDVAARQKYNWNQKEHLFFDPDSMRKYIEENHPPKGFPLVWDEAGAGKGAGRRRAMTRESTEFYELIQVIRELGLVMMYTVPSDKMIDSGLMSMFSMKIEALRIDRINNLNIVKFLMSDDAGYWKYPRDPLGNRIARITIKKPPQEFINAYKARKKEYMYEKVKVDENKKTIKPAMEFNNILKHVRDNQEGVVRTYRRRLMADPDIIWQKYKNPPYNCTARGATAVKRALESELNDD